MIARATFDTDNGKLVLAFTSFSWTSLFTNFCRPSFVLLHRVKDRDNPKIKTDIMTAMAPAMPIGTKRYESIK